MNGSNEDDLSHMDTSVESKDYLTEVQNLPLIKNGRHNHQNSKVHVAHLDLPLMHQDKRDSVANDSQPKDFQPGDRMKSRVKKNKLSLFNFNPISEQQGQASKTFSKLSVLPPIKRLDLSQTGKHFSEVMLNPINEQKEAGVLNDKAAVGNGNREEYTSSEFSNPHLAILSCDVTKGGCVVMEQHHNTSSMSMSKYTPQVHIPMCFSDPNTTELEEPQDHHMSYESQDHSTNITFREENHTGTLVKPGKKVSIHSHDQCSVDGVQNKLECMKKVELVDKWIDILEGTEFTPIPEMHVADYFGNRSNEAKENNDVSGEPIAPPNRSLHGTSKGSTSIDIMDFFDKPEPVLRHFDHLRSLNRLSKPTPKFVRFPEKNMGRRKKNERTTQIKIHTTESTQAQDEKMIKEKSNGVVQFTHPDTISLHSSKGTSTMTPKAGDDSSEYRYNETAVRQDSGQVFNMKQKDMLHFKDASKSGVTAITKDPAFNTCSHSKAVSSSKNGEPIVDHNALVDQGDEYPKSAINFEKESNAEMNADESTSQCKLHTQPCIEMRNQIEAAGTMRINASASMKTALLLAETGSGEEEEEGRLSQQVMHHHSDSNVACESDVDPVLDTIYLDSSVAYDKDDNPVLDNIYSDDARFSSQNDTAFEVGANHGPRKSEIRKTGPQRPSTADPSTQLRGVINITFPEEIQDKPTIPQKNQRIQFEGTPALNREMIQFSPPPPSPLLKSLATHISESKHASHSPLVAENKNTLTSMELNPSSPDINEPTTHPSGRTLVGGVAGYCKNHDLLEEGKQEEHEELNHFVVTNSELWYEDKPQSVEIVLEKLDVSSGEHHTNFDDNASKMGPLEAQSDGVEGIVYEEIMPAAQQDSSLAKSRLSIYDMKIEKTDEPDSRRNRVSNRFNLNASAPENITEVEDGMVAGHPISKLVPKTLHPRKNGFMGGEHSQVKHDRIKETPKQAKFLYPKKEAVTKKAKGYSTCLMEGGSTTYSRTVIATAQSKLKNTSMTNPLPYLKKDRRNVQDRFKRKSVKKMNAVVSGDSMLQYAEEQRKTGNIEPLVRLWMSGKMSPTGGIYFWFVMSSYITDIKVRYKSALNSMIFLFLTHFMSTI